MYHRECLDALLAQRGKTIGTACAHGARTPCLTEGCEGVVDALYTGGSGVKMEFRREETEVNKDREAKRAAHEAREKARAEEKVSYGFLYVYCVAKNGGTA